MAESPPASRAAPYSFAPKLECRRCHYGHQPCRASKRRDQYADPCKADQRSWNNLGANAPG